MHEAVSILLYCIAIFHVALTVSPYLCQQLHLSYVAV